MRLSSPSRKRLVILGSLLEQELRTASLESGGDGFLRTITSRRIAAMTGWTEATVRRDISLLGVRCGASNGYDVRTLHAAIKAAVSPAADSGSRGCCIVGLGRIGASLLDYGGFRDAGLDLVAGFDESVNRVEILSASFPLYPASRLEQVVAREGIRYAVLAVPEHDANRYACRLASSGIAGIVNCTSAVLTVPPSVAVEDVSVANALRNLLAKQTER